MIDREKVIKEYEDFVNGYECFCTSDDYEYEMHKAVLSLLKEQEPAKVEKRKEEAEWNVCSNCGGHLIHKWSYCPSCGREVSWDA